MEVAGKVFGTVFAVGLGLFVFTRVPAFFLLLCVLLMTAAMLLLSVLVSQQEGRQ